MLAEVYSHKTTELQIEAYREHKEIVEKTNYKQHRTLFNIIKLCNDVKFEPTREELQYINGFYQLTDLKPNKENIQEAINQIENTKKEQHLFKQKTNSITGRITELKDSNCVFEIGSKLNKITNKQNACLIANKFNEEKLKIVLENNKGSKIKLQNKYTKTIVDTIEDFFLTKFKNLDEVDMLYHIKALKGEFLERKELLNYLYKSYPKHLFNNYLIKIIDLGDRLILEILSKDEKKPKTSYQVEYNKQNHKLRCNCPQKNWGEQFKFHFRNEEDPCWHIDYSKLELKKKGYKTRKESEK